MNIEYTYGLEHYVDFLWQIRNDYIGDLMLKKASSVIPEDPVSTLIIQWYILKI